MVENHMSKTIQRQKDFTLWLNVSTSNEEEIQASTSFKNLCKHLQIRSHVASYRHNFCVAILRIKHILLLKYREKVQVNYSTIIHAPLLA